MSSRAGFFVMLWAAGLLLGCRSPSIQDIQIEPALPPAGEMIEDALLLHQRNHRHSAEALYRAAIERDPLNARAVNNLAFLLAESGDRLNESLELARRACTIEPENPAYLDTLGMVLIKSGRPAEAAKPLERAYARSDALPAAEQRIIVSRLVSVYQSTGQEHLARQVMEAHRQRDPKAEFHE